MKRRFARQNLRRKPASPVKRGRPPTRMNRRRLMLRAKLQELLNPTLESGVSTETLLAALIEEYGYDEVQTVMQQLQNPQTQEQPEDVTMADDMEVEEEQPLPPVTDETTIGELTVADVNAVVSEAVATEVEAAMSDMVDAVVQAVSEEDIPQPPVSSRPRLRKQRSLNSRLKRRVRAEATISSVECQVGDTILFNVAIPTYADQIDPFDDIVDTPNGETASGDTGIVIENLVDEVVLVQLDNGNGYAVIGSEEVVDGRVTVNPLIPVIAGRNRRRKPIRGVYPETTLHMNRMGHIELWQGADADTNVDSDVYFQSESDINAIMDSLTEDERAELEGGDYIISSNISDEYFGEMRKMKRQPTPPRRGGQPLVQHGGNMRTPVVSDMKDLKYDHLSAGQLASAMEIVRSMRASGQIRSAADPRKEQELLNVLARKAASEVQRGNMSVEVRSSLPFRTNPDQVMATNIAGYGQEWVGKLYSTDLWESVRQGSELISRMTAKGMMERQIPFGTASDVIPLEGADPTWRVAPELSATDGTIGAPKSKIQSKSIGTSNKELTVKKIGAVVTLSGEQEEDSVIQVIPQIRSQMEISAIEMIERVMLNGDTNVALPVSPFTSSPYNLNYYHSTPAAVPADDYGSYPDYTLLNGLIKTALITGSATQAYAGSTIDEDLIITLMKKLGTNGRYAAALDRCMIVMDNMTYFSMLKAPILKGSDTYAISPTVTNGEVKYLYGIDVYRSGQMDLAKSTGYIDIETAGNNTKGRMLLVRPDQWAMGWKRQVTTETNRIARADATEIVAWMRWGVAYRDSLSVSVAYNLTV